MLIVSKFHDYYDSAIGAGGVDKTIVYNRKEEERSLSGKDLDKINKNIHNAGQAFNYWNPLKNYSTTNNEGEFEFCIIGFCGKIYPVVIYHYPQETKEEDKIFYDEDSLEEFRLKMRFKIPSTYYFKYYNKKRKENAKEIFSIMGIETIDFFISINSPIFIIYPEELYSFFTKNEKKPKNLVINPQLKPFAFYRIFDSYMAFQEIAMFISGPLVKRDEVPSSPDDMHRYLSRGFDKWSFRKWGGNSKP